MALKVNALLSPSYPLINIPQVKVANFNGETTTWQSDRNFLSGGFITEIK